MTKVCFKLIFTTGGGSMAFMASCRMQRDVFLKGGQRLQFVFEGDLSGWGPSEANFGEKMH